MLKTLSFVINFNIFFGICFNALKLSKIATQTAHSFRPPSAQQQNAISLVGQWWSTFICLLDKYAFRMLYFKFINIYERADNETHPCPMNKCPMVQIKNIHGNRNDADCRRRLYHNVRTADVRFYKVT